MYQNKQYLIENGLYAFYVTKLYFLYNIYNVYVDSEICLQIQVITVDERKPLSLSLSFV